MQKAIYIRNLGIFETLLATKKKLLLALPMCLKLAINFPQFHDSNFNGVINSRTMQNYVSHFKTATSESITEQFMKKLTNGKHCAKNTRIDVGSAIFYRIPRESNILVGIGSSQFL